MEEGSERQRRISVRFSVCVCVSGGGWRTSRERPWTNAAGGGGLAFLHGTCLRLPPKVDFIPKHYMTKCHLPSGSWSPSGCADARTRMRRVSCSRTCAPSVMWLCPEPCASCRIWPNTPARSSRTWSTSWSPRTGASVRSGRRWAGSRRPPARSTPNRRQCVSTYPTPGVSFLSKKWWRFVFSRFNPA